MEHLSNRSGTARVEPNRSRTILVVEDNEDIRAVIRICLSRNGFDVVCARNGEEGLDMLDMHRPAAVFLDLAMPVMDGFRFLELRKQKRELAAIPVLVLTARHGSGDVNRAIELGARDYVTKPFEQATLIRRLNRALPMPDFRAPGATQVKWL